MKLNIDNIMYSEQDYNICICGDVTRADGSTAWPLEWVTDGHLEGTDTHLDTVQGTEFSDNEIVEISAAFKAYIAENPTPEFEYIWQSENGNGDLSGYTCSAEVLDKALDDFKGELLQQCSTDEEREGILNGKFIISHPVVTTEVRSLR